MIFFRVALLKVKCLLFNSSSTKTYRSSYLPVSNIRSAKVPEKVIKKEAARTSTSDNPLADLL